MREWVEGGGGKEGSTRAGRVGMEEGKEHLL